MKNFYHILLITVIALTSCTVSQTTHQFYHHGTDSVKTNSDFIYVKEGISGVSRTKYYPNKLRKEQGVVRQGLIADAKANLRLQHPLQANQAYANMTIDILTTSLGKTSSKGVIVSEITLEAIISADVIEFVN